MTTHELFRGFAGISSLLFLLSVIKHWMFPKNNYVLQKQAEKLAARFRTNSDDKDWFEKLTSEHGDILASISAKVSCHSNASCCFDFQAVAKATSIVITKSGVLFFHSALKAGADAIKLPIDSIQAVSTNWYDASILIIESSNGQIICDTGCRFEAKPICELMQSLCGTHQSSKSNANNQPEK